MKTTQKTLLALAISHALCHLAHADDNTALLTTIATDETGTASYQAVMANEVITIERPFSQQIGTQKLTAKDIANRPTGNGNLSELMKDNPSVRYANRTDSSNTAGEIAPDEVSIHGGKFYENNYTIDGLSNNDNINPGANNGQLSVNTPDGYSPTDLPAGGTQSFWLDGSLVKNMEVFDSNISAKYGQFTGGLINAEIKDPNSTRPSGRVWYRTTRDDWANFHVTPEDLSENATRGGFYEATVIAHQPKFTKEQYGIEINQPINDKASVLFAYNRSGSQIPFFDTRLQQWQEQERTQETYLLKGLYKADDDNTLKATLMYAPHESAYPKTGVKDGFFTNTGGGWRANLEWDKKDAWGKMTSYLAYRKTGNEIEHSANTFHNYVGNYARVDAVDWCTVRVNATGVCNFAQLGGYGTFNTEKETYTAKQDFKFNTIGTTLKHDISTGWQFDHAKASYERESDVYAYGLYRTINASNITNCTECIAGKQYAVTRTHYPARHVDANDNSFSHYVEDSMTYKKLNVVAGLRTDYSQYLGNIDVAPRLSVTYDVFGDKRTRLFGGINRYYAGSMLAYKLRHGIGTNQIQNRTLTGTTLSEWTTRSSSTGNASNSYNVSNLDTPYNDELNVGFAQKWGNSLWTLKWVRRDGKDQFTRQTVYDETNKPSHRILTNDGNNKNQNFTLSINSLSPINMKDIADVSWVFGLSYSKTKTNNSYYDNPAIDNDGIEKAIYRGELLSADEVPQTDFNTPWIVSLAINTHFPKINLDWSQRLSYTDGYRSLRRSSSTPCNSSIIGCGDYTGNVYVYTDKDNPNAFTWDWRFGYNLPLQGNQSLGLTVDVNNVLDKQIMTASPTGSSTNTGESYKLGRNFWLGVSYNW